jgi:dihydrofolate reductase
MRKLAVFNSMTLDGYFADADGDMSWAHKPDAEWNTFVAGNAKSESTLLFGRITYDMMAGFWPTPQAMRALPAVAERMNRLPKVVFSRTLHQASWQNTTMMKGDLAAAVRALKLAPGPDIVILGSGTIVAQLAQVGLIDHFQIVVNPLVLGKGKSMFAGVTERLALRLTGTRRFGNGNVLLDYEPVT